MIRFTIDGVRTVFNKTLVQYGDSYFDIERISEGDLRESVRDGSIKHLKARVDDGYVLSDIAHDDGRVDITFQTVDGNILVALDKVDGTIYLWGESTFVDTWKRENRKHLWFDMWDRRYEAKVEHSDDIRALDKIEEWLKD